MATTSSRTTPTGPRKTNIEYTEAVIIGNGPSGISLSFLLSGNLPYYNGDPHSNEYLHMRLQHDQNKSIIEQDLEYLSSGLEGRSSNPVALLFDNLVHPDADMGMETDSVLEWRHQPEKYIPHVVLGKKQVGGAWQMMDGEMQTLSLGNWMQLPDMPFKKWLAQRQLNTTSWPVTLKKDRASIQDVRNYYTEYVREKKLTSNFRLGTTVTSVERVLDVCHSVDSESGEQNPCNRQHHGKTKWEVRGHQTLTDDFGETITHEFCYRAPNVILATGTFDTPNRLCIPGESQSYILHSCSEMEAAIKNGNLTPESDPVIVVGAGLSAADSILCALAYNIPVIHVFRRNASDPQIVYRKLPSMLYPEYHMVHKMMQGEVNDSSDLYTPYAAHQIIELKDEGKVLIRGSNGAGDTLLQASHVLVQIGSRPNLSFLPHSGRLLGNTQDHPIDSKHNPISVDPYSYQSYHENGLYAMGPLAGDNFVRFLQGASLGITAHISHKISGSL